MCIIRNIMNAKLKIALLALLGFSTASCASKRAAKKSSDKEMQKIETDTVDTRIMLMYGVPMPDGRPVMIVEDEKTMDAKEFPDGSLVKPISEEEAKRLIDQMRAEEQPDSLDLQISVMYGVPFPDGEAVHEVSESEVNAKAFEDGSLVKPVSEEEAQRLIEKMRAEEKAEK